MSVKFPYLKLSLRYLHGVKSTPIFSYPTAEPAVQAPFDSAAIVDGFLTINEFYVTGCHSSRRFYTYVNVDNSNKNKDRLELTLSVESDVLISGRTLLNLFANVKGMLDADEPFNDESLCKTLHNSGFEENPLRGAIKYTGNSLKGKPCYRQYISPTELGNLLSFPRQNAYAPHSEVAFVPSSVFADQDKSLPQITQPLTQVYSVVCPEGVKPSADTVELTDRLALTYSCNGFDPTIITCEVGTTSRYMRISAPALIVNDAEKAGIVFSRHIPYKILSAKGGIVKTYTILINGRTATRNDGTFEITSTDFNNKGKVNITVSSTNYFTTSTDYTNQELFAQQPLELTLVPEQLNVSLRMDFGEGRIIEQQVTLEKASTEYRNLRAGHFHGFHAHRLMGGEPETYNVDMTVSNSAVKTDATPESEIADIENGNEAVTEVRKPKSAAELRAERHRTNLPFDITEAEKKKKNKHRPTYAEDLPEKTDNTPDDTEVEESEISHNKTTPIILAVVAVILITAGIVWYLFTLLPSADKSQTENATEATSQITDAETQRITVTDDIPDETVTQDTKTETVASAGPTAEEQADITYLNSTHVWVLSDLKSEKYRSFFRLISDGDIQSIAESDYFAVKGQANNPTALKIIELIWQSKGTFAEKRISKELKSLKDRDRINLYNLYERLARMRDAKSNTEPRPQR